MEYNSDFSVNKGVDTDDKGKPEPLLTLDMVVWPQDEKCRLKYVMLTQCQNVNGAVCPACLAIALATADPTAASG